MPITHTTLVRLADAGFPLGALLDGAPLRTSTEPYPQSGAPDRVIHTSTCHPDLRTAPWRLGTGAPSDEVVRLCPAEIDSTDEHSTLRAALGLARLVGLGALETLARLRTVREHLEQGAPPEATAGRLTLLLWSDRHELSRDRAALAAKASNFAPSTLPHVNAVCAYLDSTLEEIRTVRALVTENWFTSTDPTAPRRYALVRAPRPLSSEEHRRVAATGIPALPAGVAADYAASCPFEAVTVPDLRDQDWWGPLVATGTVVDLGPATAPVPAGAWHEVLTAASADPGATEHVAALFAALLTATAPNPAPSC